MLGMNQIKKKMLIGFGIGLLIGLVIAGITIGISVVTVKGYEEGTNKNFIAKYQKEVVCFKKDVIQGEKIKKDMVNSVYVHIKNVPQKAIGSEGDAIGKVAKYNVPKSIPLVDGMLTESLMGKDVRSVEYNTILMPSDIIEGDTVDIRVMFPSGIDYVVLSQMKVNKISNLTMWFDISEEQLLLMNGAMVDSFLNEGTKLYAVKYSDPDSQIVYGKDESVDVMKAKIYDELDVLSGQDKNMAIESVYSLIQDFSGLISSKKSIEQNYMPNTQIQDLMRTRPNILDQAKEKLSEENRLLIEAQIASYKAQYEDDYDKVTSGITDSITRQEEERQGMLDAAKAEEDAAAAAAEADAGADANAEKTE
ncbi:MAG: hypothetical protein RR988_01725 [Clostridia bacterium]